MEWGNLREETREGGRQGTKGNKDGGDRETERWRPAKEDESTVKEEGENKRRLTKEYRRERVKGVKRKTDKGR